MNADKTDRPCRALYDVTFFDFDWNEIAELRLVHCTAHEMVMAVERFNQNHQRIARDPAIIIPPIPTVLSIGIEVYYVEKEER